MSRTFFELFDNSFFENVEALKWIFDMHNRIWYTNRCVCVCVCGSKTAQCHHGYEHINQKHLFEYRLANERDSDTFRFEIVDPFLLFYKCYSFVDVVFFCVHSNSATYWCAMWPCVPYDLGCCSSPYIKCQIDKK